MASNKSKNGLQPSSSIGRLETRELAQNQLLDLHFELNAFGFLFSNLKNCELSEDDLYGMGIIFSKMAKRVSKLSEDLNLNIS